MRIAQLLEVLHDFLSVLIVHHSVFEHRVQTVYHQIQLLFGRLELYQVVYHVSKLQKQRAVLLPEVFVLVQERVSVYNNQLSSHLATRTKRVYSLNLYL